ncbi:MAG: MlaD family protein [Puniceicoccales bacterium]|jgi:paraquat-inducible protein B|nr:MlaD family protein [Puniceicoccales bacterium]
MKTTSDTTAVGLFTVVGILAFIIAILLFTNGAFLSKDHMFVLYFDESVNGLDVGAPVKIRGVCVGSVKKVVAHFDRERKCVRVPVTIILEDAYFRTGRRERLRISREDREMLQNAPNAETTSASFRCMPLIVGMVGSLQTESLVTGKLFVDLNYEPTLAHTYLRLDENGIPEIPTKPSNLSNLNDQLNAIADGLSGIDYATIGEGIKRLVMQLSSVEWKALAHSITGAASSVESLVGGEEVRTIGQKVRAICGNIEEFSAQLQSDTGPLLQSSERMCRELAALSHEMRGLLMSGAPLPIELETLLKNMGAAAESVRNFFDLLEQNPSALLVGKPKGQ